MRCNLLISGYDPNWRYVDRRHSTIPNSVDDNISDYRKRPELPPGLIAYYAKKYNCKEYNILSKGTGGPNVLKARRLCCESLMKAGWTPTQIAYRMNRTKEGISWLLKSRQKR